MKVKLFNGDCSKVLPTFQDSSFDCVITSPPYNMNLRIRNGKYCSRQITKEISTKYSGFSDNLPMDEYYKFHSGIIDQLIRVSKLVFYNIQMVTGNKPAMLQLIGEYRESIKEIIIWDKNHGQPAIRDNVLNSQYEFILVLSKDAMTRRFDKANFKRGTLSNVWKISRGKKIDPSHGATFPEELVRTIIDNFTLKGDKVLDPFMGVGTTGVVCKKLNRDFVGIELSKQYFDTSLARIKNT